MAKYVAFYIECERRYYLMRGRVFFRELYWITRRNKSQIASRWHMLDISVADPILYVTGSCPGSGVDQGSTGWSHRRNDSNLHFRKNKISLLTLLTRGMFFAEVLFRILAVWHCLRVGWKTPAVSCLGGSNFQMAVLMAVLVFFAICYHVFELGVYRDV